MELKIAVLGFGNVGRALARLLLHKALVLEEDFDLTCSVVGLMTAQHGSAVDPAGIDLQRALRLAELGASLDELSTIPPPDDSLLFQRQNRLPTSVLCEIICLFRAYGCPGWSEEMAEQFLSRDIVIC